MRCLVTRTGLRPGRRRQPPGPRPPRPRGPALVRARTGACSLLASSPGRRCLRVTQEEALVARPSALIQPDSGPGKTQGDSAVTNRLSYSRMTRTRTRSPAGGSAGTARGEPGRRPAEFRPQRLPGEGSARGRHAGSGGLRVRVGPAQARPGCEARLGPGGTRG